MTDLTPAVPEGRQFIQGYGDGRFRISGVVHDGSVIVFADITMPWDAGRYSDISIDGLRLVISRAAEIDILIVGCGPKFKPSPPSIAHEFSAGQIALEMMDTGAACRTYNLLLADGRRVAAALIAVD
ncbi:MAG: hypothetical protein GY791_06560 [Alphaproteobacteria bacterium]|nr:hypothetical protein [Alphaproteobacteria bacterium]